MSGAEVLAVVACVAAIVSAYHDGSNLVRRIKEKRLEKKRALAERPAQDLEDSLALGPPVVQGQYDGDFRRFGSQYAQGDPIAREQMKDIIINLQMALLSNLRLASEDDVEINFVALQIASDNSRVDAVMTLCQLYQRMAAAAPLQAGPNTMVMSGMGIPQFTPQLSASPPDHRFSYASTAPSVSNFGGHMSTSPPKEPVRHGSVEARSPITKQRTTSSIGSTFTSKRRSLLSSLRNSGSQSSTDVDHTVSSSQQFPITPVSELGAEGDPRYTNRPGAERNSFPQMQTRQPDRQQRPSAGDASLRTISSHLTNRGSGPYFPSEEVFNPWIQQDSDDDDDMAPNSPDTPSRRIQSWDHPALEYSVADRWSTAIKENNVEPAALSVHETAPPVRAPSSNVSRHSTNSSLSGTMAVSTGVSMTLYLPCEENGFAGFCKGAWKLQIGVKKAFKPESRPAGMYNDIPFWRCSKCFYEGPMAGGATKSTRRYDNRVRIHEATGVRYRWVFLAKSHIHTRKVPTGTDGTVGTFGCIFCCAERRGPTPTFGNLASFMEHLLQHRRVAPEMEMLLDRTRCIIGRVADVSEDFDLNLPPAVMEMS